MAMKAVSSNLTTITMLCNWEKQLTVIFTAWLEACGGNALPQ